MSICPNCNNENRDSSSFCFFCGAALPQENNSAVANGPAVTDGAEPKTTADSEIMQPFVDENIYFLPDENSRRKKIIITALVSIFIISAIFVTGRLTNWFGLGSPLYDLSKALNKTFSSQNFNMKITMESNGMTSTMNYRYVLDQDEKEFIIMGTTEQSGIGANVLLYNGTSYAYASYGEQSYGTIQENAFDEDQFFKQYEELLKNEDDEIDYEELIKEAGLKEYVNADQLEDFIDNLQSDKLHSKEWLEDYMGFTEEDDVYIFSPNLGKLVEEIRKTCDASNAFTKKGKNYINDALKNPTLLTSIEQIKVKLAFTIDDNYISEIKMYISVAGGEQVIITIEFDDINETEITDGEIRTFIDKTKEYVAKSTCAVCGENTMGSLHGDCSECGEHGNLVDDSICFACYYSEFETPYDEPYNFSYTY